MPWNSDQIQEELGVSEALLGDILAVVGGKIPKVEGTYVTGYQWLVYIFLHSGGQFSRCSKGAL